MLNILSTNYSSIQECMRAFFSPHMHFKQTTVTITSLQMISSERGGELLTVGVKKCKCKRCFEFDVVTCCVVGYGTYSIQLQYKTFACMKKHLDFHLNFFLPAFNFYGLVFGFPASNWCFNDQFC